MRYFDLKLTDANGNVPTVAGTRLQWTTHPKGLGGPFDANYPLITFDALAMGDLVVGGSTNIRVFGVPLELLSEAVQLGGLTCTLSGGMVKGLPLASAHPGVLIKGTVWQAIGNWIGEVQALDLVVTTLMAKPDTPRPVLWKWSPGQSLASAINAAMAPIFGPLNMPVDVSGVSANYAPPASVKMGLYEDVPAFGLALHEMTRRLPEGPVTLAATGKRILARSSNPVVLAKLAAAMTAPVINIEFNDLMGQPAWINLAECQLKVQLRGDLDVGRRVRILQSGQTVLQTAPGLVTVTAASGFGTPIMANGAKYKPAFAGVHYIWELRHLGDSRSSDSQQWATILNVVPISPPGFAGSLTVAQPVPSPGGPT